MLRRATNRKLAVVGRSMVNVVTIAGELGYLHIPEGMLIEPEEVNKLPADRVAILSTGSQGEPMSALNPHGAFHPPKVDILPGDTVIIAATPIPGNETLCRANSGRIVPARGERHLRPGNR